jgi:general nucleoside transport system permease protein
MNNSIAMLVAASAILYGTPILYAALGELLAERSGVLNLGVEGMMLVGAAMASWSIKNIEGPAWLSLTIAVVIGAVAAALMAAIHAFLTITLRANQIVSGLTLTIFAGAAGLSSYLAGSLRLADNPSPQTFDPVLPKSWQDVPIVGPILFGHNMLVYLSWILTAVVGLYLARTRHGLNTRAVGESPAAADSLGINVTAYRYVHTIVGGAFAGVGGAFYSLSLTPTWVDGLTFGIGWIAVALVIFAFWRADLCLVGAYLFGAFQSLGFILDGRGIWTAIPQEAFQALPYLITIIALVAVSSGWAKRRLGAPGALGVPYVREER